MGARLLVGLPPLRLLRRLGNPIASEAAAFRWLLVCVVAIFAIVGVVLLLRTL